MNKLFGAFAVAIVMLLPTIGAAEGFYVSGHAGAVFLNESDNTDQSGVSVPTDFDTGFGVGGALGYDFPNNFRVEVEITYRESDVDTVDVSEVVGLGDLDGSGDVSVIAFMANVYYEIDIDQPVTPYIGVGIGAAVVSANDVALATTAPPSIPGLQLTDDDDTVFAYQVIVGIGYDVTENLTLTLDYRFFGTQGAELDIDPRVGFPVSGTTFDGEYQSHNVMVAARFSF